MTLALMFSLYKNNVNHVKNIRKVLEHNKETQSFLHFFFCVINKFNYTFKTFT